jgi:hypothetical protein
VALLAPLAVRAEGSRYADGLAAFERGDYRAAIDAWRPAASAGDPRAQLGLALIFQRKEPEGLADDEEALHWLRKAALQGVPAARNDLAIFYAKGRGGIAPNPELALHHWREAANAGYALAMVNLARALERGLGTQSDPAEAARWYHAAAELGQPDAQRALATLYREGRGVARDPEQAQKWEAAADAGAPRLPAVSSAPSPGASPAVAEPGPPPAAEPAPEHALDPGVYAQLASLPTAASAAQSAAELEREHAEALAGRQARVWRADLGERGVWFRVLVGPFADADGARRLCGALRAQSSEADCLVVPRASAAR